MANRTHASVKGRISATPMRMKRKVLLHSRQAIHHTATKRIRISVVNEDAQGAIRVVAEFYVG